jgi:FtsP/CotA-like multicopper oxidase with cupredoxin domain/plastocyanin
MRRFRWGVLPLFVALSLVTVACDGGDGGDVAAGEGTAGAGSAPTSVEVTLTDFAIEPGDVAVAAGAPVTLHVINEGPSPHTFGVTVGDQTYETALLEAGAMEDLALPALEAGTYDSLCTVPGHDQLGMVGTVTAGGDAAGGAASGDAAATDHANMTAEEMAEGHSQGVQDFLAGKETDTKGGQLLEPTIDDGVKVYDLTVSEIQWEVAEGEFKEAMAFNGTVPGPEIRVQEGDRVRFVVQNQLSEPFALHFHGVTLPNSEDGVPYITQPAVMPGEYWTYEFDIVDPPGIYVYHSHFNSAEQVGKGLYGALIVEPKNGDWASVYGVDPDVEYTMFVGDGLLGFNLNGKSFPATEPIVASKGDWALIHMSNDGEQLHPMHLHGFHFMVVGQDGFPFEPEDRYMADTLVIAPGQRFDILVKADAPGAWAFHCHILSHAEGPAGMFGMVTALVVE